MAATRHQGTSEWFRDWSAPGLRVLFTSKDIAGNAFIGGAFWNDEESTTSTIPSRFPLKDITGRATSLRLKTLTAFSGQIGSIVYTDVNRYPDDIWDQAYFTSGSAEVEICGIPKDHIVDLVLAGASGNTDTRGGTYRITPDGREVEVINGSANAGFTGPVMFRGIEPVSGAIQIEFTKITSFCYWSFFDLRAYRR